MPALVLASTSPYRRELLARLGLPFDAVAPEVDEAPLMGAALTPAEIASQLALAKARAVAALRPDDFVLGGDQLVALGDEVLGKPGSPAAAITQLKRLRGTSHRLITALALVGPGFLEQATDVHVMHVRDLRDDEIERYVAADDPSDCAGSYKVEQLGIALFERIEGEDHTAIVGLPLVGLAAMLRRAGFQVP